MKKDEIIAASIKEANEFINYHHHFHDVKTIATFAIAEYICNKQGVSLYLAEKKDRLAESA